MGGMNILILGGNSKHHYDWVRELAKALKSGKRKVVFLDYKHWQTDGSILIDDEINSAAELGDELGEYIVVAKSVGTIITALGVADGKLKPAGCLLLGMPLTIIKEYYPDFADKLTSLPRTVYLQNAEDPYGSAEMLEEYLEDKSPADYHMVTVPGDTHDYVNYTSIGEIVNDLAK